MIKRIAIIGAGGMGRFHAKNLERSGQAMICGVYDNDIAASRELGKCHNVPVYEDWLDMYGREKPDAVFICLPPFAHGEEGVEAARRGIPIFMEKPIGLSVAESESLVSTVLANNIITQVGYHCRYGSAVRHLHRLIQERRTGKPVLFTGSYACNSLHSPWWRDKSKSGSQILEQVIHTYDMAMLFFGRPVLAMGLMGNLCHEEVQGYTIEDVSASVTRFGNGALASITATNCAIPGKWDNKFSLVFEKMTCSFENPNHAIFVDTATEGKPAEVFDEPVDLYYEEVLDFLNLLQGARQVGCSIPEALESLRLVEAITYSANQEGQAVKLTDWFARCR